MFAQYRKKPLFYNFWKTIPSCMVSISLSPTCTTRKPWSSIFCFRRSYPQPIPSPSFEEFILLVGRHVNKLKGKWSWASLSLIRFLWYDETAGSKATAKPSGLMTLFISSSIASTSKESCRTSLMIMKSNFLDQSSGSCPPLLHKYSMFFGPSFESSLLA